MGHSNFSEKESYITELDSRYSTTRCVSKQQPILTNNQENKDQSSLFPLPENVEMIEGGLRLLGYVKDSFPDQPLITVITIVYNGDKHLEQTIKSVISQTYNNVEYIIIDGGSTDGTLDIIKQYNTVIDYWISEPDNGIADAMNKGIKASTGEYVIFIHADDYLANCYVLSEVFIEVSQSDEIILCDILFGDKLKRIKPRGFNYWLNFRNGVPHQGAICKLSLFKALGYFNVKYKIVMDYDFFIRAYRVGIKVKKISIVLSIMRDGGISSRTNWPDLLVRFKEEKQIHKNNVNSFSLLVCYLFFWFLYTPYKWAVTQNKKFI